LTSDPVPDLRWVHGIKHPGCFRVRTGTSVGSQIPRCVKTEVSVWSATDFVARDRGEDSCTGRGVKAIDDYCLARDSQLFVAIYITADLSAVITINPDFRMARARTRQRERCREQPRQ